MLNINKLRASYGNHVVLDGLDLQVERGRLVCLLGPNGAGKSTLLRLIAGQQMADSGEIHVAGHEISVAPESAPAHVAYVPQEVVLWDYLTASETLEVVCGLRNVEHERRGTLISDWLERTYLAAVPRTIARDMSGGMRRKLAVAAAMIGSPPLVLLDESFVGLDPESAWNLMTALRDYTGAGGTVVLSSHVLDMVEAIADEVVFLHRGAIARRLDRFDMRRVLDEHGVQLSALYMNIIHGRALDDATAWRQL